MFSNSHYIIAKLLGLYLCWNHGKVITISKQINQTLINKMNRIKTLLILLIAINLFACSNTNTDKKPESNKVEVIENPTNRVVLSSEIKWEKLNPARGDKSPQAGTVWGDRKGAVSTGFLAKFVDGFSSPPHIHNVTYRAVVIKGLIHNDDPKAENMWMSPGSFWTQPVGESHITSAKGDENMAYVEIDSGPYLVKPTSEAFESKEKPINVDKSNVMWLNSSKSNWVEKNCKAEISFLWDSKNNDGLKGLFVKLPTGFKGKIHSDGTIFHAIVIQGNPIYHMPNDAKEKKLDPASYFGSKGKSIHAIDNIQKDECIIYIRTNGVVKLE